MYLNQIRKQLRKIILNAGKNLVVPSLEMSIRRKFLECNLALQIKNLKQVCTLTHQ